MTIFNSDVTYDSNVKTITVKGKTVVDLQHVPENAEAVVYSKLDSTHSGLTTSITFNESRQPFDFKYFSLSPEAFIAAIKENRLEMEGMVIHETIDEVYSQIWNDKKNTMRSLAKELRIAANSLASS